jgi:hypothetical protein
MDLHPSELYSNNLNIVQAGSIILRINTDPDIVESYGGPRLDIILVTDIEEGEIVGQWIHLDGSDFNRIKRYISNPQRNRDIVEADGAGRYINFEDIVIFGPNDEVDPDEEYVVYTGPLTTKNETQLIFDKILDYITVTQYYIPDVKVAIQ